MLYNTNTNEVAYKNVYQWLPFNHAFSKHEKQKNKTLQKSLMNVLQTKYQSKCTQKDLTITSYLNDKFS